LGESVTGVAHLGLGLLRLDPAQRVKVGVTVPHNPREEPDVNPHPAGFITSRFVVSVIRSVPADEVALGESIAGAAHLWLGLLRLNPAQRAEVGVTVPSNPRKET
jgi:hypothetical protein